MKTILIFALNRTPWIGGIYYRKNIVNMMLRNDAIRQKYRIVVLVNKKHAEVFRTFGDQIDLELCEDGIGIVQAMVRAMLCCFKYRVKYVFPLRPFSFLKYFGITAVSWIADFQHCVYPEFFSEEEVALRNRDFRQMAEANNPLVLSSQAALRDFETYFSKERKNVFVVPFTSCIDDELQLLEHQDETQILRKFGLENARYAVVCNQFWQHKDHVTVLRAIKQLSQQGKNAIQFVFTGELSDRRNPEYIEKVRGLMDDPEIKPWVKLLGFIDRSEQLCVMKHAQFIIQPSLFEGWGTVVEDGKVLNKRILLSDIPVHKEQMNENCMLFEAHNPEDLMKKIQQMRTKDSEACRTDDKTVEYGKNLEMVFQ